MVCESYAGSACLPPSLDSCSTQDGGLLLAPMLPARDSKQGVAACRGERRPLMATGAQCLGRWLACQRYL